MYCKLVKAVDVDNRFVHPRYTKLAHVGWIKLSKLASKVQFLRKTQIDSYTLDLRFENGRDCNTTHQLWCPSITHTLKL